MVKVQRVRVPASDQVSWLVLGDDFLPIGSIQEFLVYLENIERSPNTIRSYAHHLCLYWQYVQEYHLDWTTIGLSELAEFVAWLRRPSSDIICMQRQEAKRSEATINVILAAVCSFYDYQERLEHVQGPALYREQVQPYRTYKTFLHHINKGKPVRTRLINLMAPKRLHQTLTPDQVLQLIAACHRLRDQFLVSHLYETGMRVGQLLGWRKRRSHDLWSGD